MRIISDDAELKCFNRVETPDEEYYIAGYKDTEFIKITDDEWDEIGSKWLVSYFQANEGTIKQFKFLHQYLNELIELRRAK